jgi:CRP-like cAMP-binding protein
MENLLRAIRSFAPVPEGEARKFCGIVAEQSYQKGDVFIEAGSIPQKLAFVEGGLFRYYYANEKGSEFTKGFFPENSFIMSYTAMISNAESHFSVEALEDSRIFVFSYDAWKAIFQGNSCWTPFVIGMLEKGYSKKESRERELLLLSAEERYRNFLREYPQLEKRVKQHLIASYLGITPVALSRIRKQMS